MKRTIEIRSDMSYYGGLYYGGRFKGIPTYGINRHFGLRKGRYQITIKKGGAYQIKAHPEFGHLLRVYKDDSYISNICKKEFTQLFFKPHGRSRYDITVKKVGKNRRKK